MLIAISQATAKRILSSWQQSGEKIDSYEHVSLLLMMIAMVTLYMV